MDNGTIIGVSILAGSVVLVGLAVLLSYLSYRKQSPKIWIQGVGIRYRPGALQPWSGLEEVLSAVRQVLSEKYPKHVDKMMNFWVDVVPHDGVVDSYTLRGRTPREGKQWNGTIDRTAKALFWTQYIMVVRQMVDKRAATPTDSPKIVLRSARGSGLLHEIVEHYVPFILNGDWNPYHDQVWSDLRAEIHKKYLEKRS